MLFWKFWFCFHYSVESRHVDIRAVWWRRKLDGEKFLSIVSAFIFSDTLQGKSFEKWHKNMLRDETDGLCMCKRKRGLLMEQKRERMCILACVCGVCALGGVAQDVSHSEGGSYKGTDQQLQV